MIAQGKVETVEEKNVKLEFTEEQFQLLAGALRTSLFQAEQALEHAIGASRRISADRVKKLTELLDELYAVRKRSISSTEGK